MTGVMVDWEGTERAFVEFVVLEGQPLWILSMLVMRTRMDLDVKTPARAAQIDSYWTFFVYGLSSVVRLCSGCKSI